MLVIVWLWPCGWRSPGYELLRHVGKLKELGLLLPISRFEISLFEFSVSREFNVAVILRQGPRASQLATLLLLGKHKIKCEMNYNPCLVASLQSRLPLTASFTALKCLISLVTDTTNHLDSFWPDYWRSPAIYVSFPGFKRLFPKFWQ